MDNQPSFEKYTLHAVECYLRGKQWKDALNPFFTTNSPRFRNFCEFCKPDTQSTIKEVDIQMHTVHLEFKDLVEQHLYNVITNMGLTEERFTELLEVELNTEDEAVHRLYTTLTSYRDFMKFGQMMQSICNELYPSQSPTATTAISIETMKRTKICRVLWDIENIQVNPNIGGIQTVLALQKFLKHEDLMGNGIDTRISAFFNPYNKSLSKKIIEELNKASVELICASTKREDADRKLGMRINQEMQILIPELTTFVIVSSDQDFRQHVQLLSNAAYTTIVVHEAKHESWRSALEMHASKGVDWTDVMKFLPPQTPSAAQCSDHRSSSTGSSSSSKERAEVSAVIPPGPSGEKLKHTLPEQQGSMKTKKNSHNSDKKLPESAPDSLVQSTIQSSEEAHSNEAPPQQHYRNTAKEAAAVGWRVAVCQRWVSAYGFLLVDISHPEVSSEFVLESPD